MKNKNLYVTVLLVALFSAVSFFAGKNFPGRGVNQGGPRGQFGTQDRGMDNSQRLAGSQMRGGQIIGEITTIESDKVTIKEIGGSSKVILIGEETNIVRTTAALPADLKVGSKIAVFGKATTDAIISAQNIQIDPQNRIMATPSASPQKINM